MFTRIRKAIDERDEGFTLIELLVVIIIIGILAAIAIPVFLNQRKKGWDSQAKSDLRNAATAEETYLGDSSPSVYTSTTADLTTNGFKQTSGVKFGVKADGANGYCAVAKSQSGKYFVYDSTAGGLAPGAGSASYPPAWPGGTCAVAANRPADAAIVVAP